MPPIVPLNVDPAPHEVRPFEAGLPRSWGSTPMPRTRAGTTSRPRRVLALRFGLPGLDDIQQVALPFGWNATAALRPSGDELVLSDAGAPPPDGAIAPRQASVERLTFYAGKVQGEIDDIQTLSRSAIPTIADFLVSPAVFAEAIPDLAWISGISVARLEGVRACLGGGTLGIGAQEDVERLLQAVDPGTGLETAQVLELSPAGGTGAFDVEVLQERYDLRFSGGTNTLLRDVAPTLSGLDRDEVARLLAAMVRLRLPRPRRRFRPSRPTPSARCRLNLSATSSVTRRTASWGPSPSCRRIGGSRTAGTGKAMLSGTRRTTICGARRPSAW